MLFAAIAAFGLMSSLYLTSCEEDLCKDPDKFGVHGKCVDGVAVCDPGYEVDPGNGRCDVITSTLWLGDYNAEDFDTKGASATGKYASKIQAIAGAGNENKVSIQDLGFYECKNTATNTVIPYFVEGTVKGDSIKIDYKTCNNTFKGAGYFNRSAKIVTINYTATYGTPAKTDVNKAVLVKK
jgi:hypothetical protein